MFKLWIETITQVSCQNLGLPMGNWIYWDRSAASIFPDHLCHAKREVNPPLSIFILQLKLKGCGYWGLTWCQTFNKCLLNNIKSNSKKPCQLWQISVGRVRRKKAVHEVVCRSCNKDGVEGPAQKAKDGTAQKHLVWLRDMICDMICDMTIQWHDHGEVLSRNQNQWWKLVQWWQNPYDFTEIWTYSKHCKNRHLQVFDSRALISDEPNPDFLGSNHP